MGVLKTLKTESYAVGKDARAGRYVSRMVFGSTGDDVTKISGVCVSEEAFRWRAGGGAYQSIRSDYSSTTPINFISLLHATRNLTSTSIPRERKPYDRLPK